LVPPRRISRPHAQFLAPTSKKSPKFYSLDVSLALSVLEDKLEGDRLPRVLATPLVDFPCGRRRGKTVERTLTIFEKKTG